MVNHNDSMIVMSFHFNNVYYYIPLEGFVVVVVVRAVKDFLSLIAVFL